jgi:hypothetical protein
VGDTVTSAPFVGKTVLIEKQKDDKYHFFVDGKELTDKDAELLAADFRHKDDDPDSARKILVPHEKAVLNKPWTIDVKKLAEDFGKVPIDADKAQATGKLVKVYQKNGHSFGVFEVHIDMPLTGEIGAPGKTIPIPAGSKLTGECTVDTCIDGSVSDGSIETGIRITLNGPVTVNNVDIKLNIATKRSEKKSGTELPAEKN